MYGIKIYTDCAHASGVKVFKNLVTPSLLPSNGFHR